MFHQTFNRLKLFVHCLLQQNEMRDNLNAGFVVALTEDQLEVAEEQLDEALSWAGRRSVILNARGRTFCQLAEELIQRPCRTKYDAFEAFRHELLRNDRVVVISELSASKLGAEKIGKAKSMIKIMDDAHFEGVTPRGGLFFIDYASFLEKAWSMIGIYLNVVTVTA